MHSGCPARSTANRTALREKLQIALFSVLFAQSGLSSLVYNSRPLIIPKRVGRVDKDLKTNYKTYIQDVKNTIYQYRKLENKLGCRGQGRLTARASGAVEQDPKI